MYKPHQVPQKVQFNYKPKEDDEWETDPNFVNDVTAKQSRYGAKSNPVTLEARSTERTDLNEFYKTTVNTYTEEKKKEYHSSGADFNRGYGK